MSYTEKITYKIFKIKADSNLYFLNLNTKLVIDTGSDSYKGIVKTELSKLIDIDKIKIVIFTHLHYDHIGNIDLFGNAKFFASAKEIEDFEKSSYNATLGKSKLNIKLNPIKSLEGFKIINTPGHTRGSICLFYLKEKILFSGDTLFYHGIGRTDLPSSAPELMQESLNKLKKLNYKILCPGHDY